MEDLELYKKELALLLMLGLVSLKTTPYLKVYNERFGISKELYKQLKSKTIGELIARYSFVDINENRKEND